MPEQILKNVGIWIDGRNLAGVSNAVGITLEVEAPESTSFADEWRSRSEGGLKTAGLSLEGWYDRGDIDLAQFESLGNDGSAMIAPAGQTAGDVAYVVPYAANAWEPGASIGELMAFTFAGEGDGEVVRAQVFDIREGVGVDVTVVRRQLGAVAAGQTLEVWLHVAENAATGTLTATLRSSASVGGATTDRGAVTPTETGLHRISVSGAVAHQWWELGLDVGGANPDYDIAVAYWIG